MFVVEMLVYKASILLLMLNYELKSFLKPISIRGNLIFFCKILIVIFYFAVTQSGLKAQTFTIDTADFYQGNDSLIFVNSNDTLTGIEVADESEDLEELPSGEIKFLSPAEANFNSIWDTLYIRTVKINFAEMSDTAYLVLNPADDTPFHFPFKGKLISKYGWRSGRFHAGMDIKLLQGDTVVAAFDGKVRIARTMRGYGKMVVLRHNNGLETVYAHFSKILVKNNQVVKAGEPIGLGGRTGRATGTHLHFETRYLGEHFNPDRIMDFENHTLIKDTLAIHKEFWLNGKSGSLASAYDQGAPGDAKYHTIRQGDTLGAIARKYRTSVKRICQLNGIKETKILRIGKRIRVA